MDTLDPSEFPKASGYVPRPSGSVSSAEQSLQSLRLLFVAALATLLILSASLNLYLYKQSKLARQELDKTQPVVAQMAAEYNQKSIPLINDFLARLQAFAKTNPDFYPILARHLEGNVAATKPIQSGGSNSQR